MEIGNIPAPNVGISMFIENEIGQYRSSMHDCYCTNTKCEHWELKDRFGCRKYDFRNIEECREYVKYEEVK